MSTTLPLFWNLSSVDKKARIDASSKLIGALERFQADFVAKQPEPSSDHAEVDEKDAEDDDEGEDGSDASLEDQENGVAQDGLDKLNAEDVTYSVRRLVRGLASPRESSRLGFAVALTELLSRLNSITCDQILRLVLTSSKTHGSMTGQEERDVLFARLFGFTAIIRSGLLFRSSPLSSSSAPCSTLESYQNLVKELIALGEKKSWLRESCWWALKSAIEELRTSQVEWSKEAWESMLEMLYVQNKTWTPEKVGVTLVMQNLWPDEDWDKWTRPVFKQSKLLSAGNFATLAKILKEAYESDEGTDNKSSSGSWKPQIHWVWDTILDELLPASGSPSPSFHEFYRICVDESLFANTSSAERKYWGFQIFQRCLARSDAQTLPMLFPKNFMRCWINHLSKKDRYLHSAARAAAADVQNAVQKDPSAGFALIMQLTGPHGSQSFDKLTRTKTVEGILASTDAAGITAYIEHLMEQFNAEDAGSDVGAIEARRAWLVDQLAGLVRNGAVPKDHDWVKMVLDFLVVHSAFKIVKKTQKSPYAALREIPKLDLSEGLRRHCREKLFACLADLTGQNNRGTGAKINGSASDGRFWISRALDTVNTLSQDTKHVQTLRTSETNERDVVQKAYALSERIDKIENEPKDLIRGARLLLDALNLHVLLSAEDQTDLEQLETCFEGISRMFPAEKKKKTKARKSDAPDSELSEPKPIDMLVDSCIGMLEKSTAYMRVVANQSFGLLSGAVEESTINLILTQLERRDVTAEDEDAEMEDGTPSEANEDDNADENDEENGGDSESDDDNEGDEDMDEVDEENNLELRNKLEAALRPKGAGTEDSDEESEEAMDDEQMMAIDEQLAEIFRSRKEGKKQANSAQREATHFKNRVLDFVDIFVKSQPSSSLISRLILPLVTVIAGTGSDEKQLSDKAHGLLRSRIGKLKEVPKDIDADTVTTIFVDLHSRARKVHSSEMLSTLSPCSLYLARNLLHHNLHDPVRDAYLASLEDFMTRKASPLNAAFFAEFFKRHTSAAWDWRETCLELVPKAANAYRMCQSLGLVQVLVNQLPSLHKTDSDVAAFMRSLCQVLLDTLSSACDGTSSLNAAQMKDVLKLALSAVRQMRRLVTSPDDVKGTWQPAKWRSMQDRLQTVPQFKESKGLHAMCRQMAEIAGSDDGTKPKQTTGKRKAGDAMGKDHDAEDDDDAKREEPKRKQATEEKGKTTGEGVNASKPKVKKVKKGTS